MVIHTNLKDDQAEELKDKLDILLEQSAPQQSVLLQTKSSWPRQQNGFQGQTQ